MKRIISLVLVCALLFCACSKADKDSYADARKATVEQKAYTAVVENELTVDGDESVKGVYKDNVRYAQGNGILSAKVSGEDGNVEYYYKDGTMYSISDAGQFSWTAKSEELFGDICFEKPLEYDFGNGEKKDGAVVYRAELNGNDYKEMLLAINPKFEDFKLSESDFTSFVYTATVKDGRITSYTYEFTLNARSGEESAILKNVMNVTYEETPDNVKMPTGYESYEVVAGNIFDISEEEFTREVMLIIVEALYNNDGTRKDDFDETYAEFVDMYGEETMSTFIGGIEEFNKSQGIGQ